MVLYILSYILLLISLESEESIDTTTIDPTHFPNTNFIFLFWLAS